VKLNARRQKPAGVFLMVCRVGIEPTTI
jgi:hypothetical protein